MAQAIDTGSHCSGQGRVQPGTDHGFEERVVWGQGECGPTLQSGAGLHQEHEASRNLVQLAAHHFFLPGDVQPHPIWYLAVIWRINSAVSCEGSHMPSKQSCTKGLPWITSTLPNWLPSPLQQAQKESRWGQMWPPHQVPLWPLPDRILSTLGWSRRSYPDPCAHDTMQHAASLVLLLAPSFPSTDFQFSPPHAGREEWCARHFIVQLSSTDLLSCQLVNQIFTCDSFWIVFRMFNDTCLGALYMQKFRSVLRRVCWTSKSDLSSTTKCDQNHITHTYNFGHT